MTVPSTRTDRRAGMFTVPRSRGAVTGLLIVLLGIWGALVPLVGPYFNYGFTPDDAWHLTGDRFLFNLLPGIVAIVGGLMLMLSANRPVAVLGAWLALAAGVWYVTGVPLSGIWDTSAPGIGAPMGGHARQALAQLGFFSALGAAITGLAAFALGRLSIRSVRDLELYEERRLRTTDRDDRIAAGVPPPERTTGPAAEAAEPAPDHARAARQPPGA